jgi:hypothetical protein
MKRMVIVNPVALAALLDLQESVELRLTAERKAKSEAKDFPHEGTAPRRPVRCPSPIPQGHK